MSQWAWVILGYAVTVVVIAGYLIALGQRWSRARRRAGEQR